MRLKLCLNARVAEKHTEPAVIHELHLTSFTPALRAACKQKLQTDQQGKSLRDHVFEALPVPCRPAGATITLLIV
jgi:1,4-alpha-glucan branching enzyme